MVPKPEWLAALRDACGDQVRLSWNATVGRWQFDVLCVDGEYRAQFLCQTKHPVTGVPLEAEAHGYLPFRDLNDEVLREVIRNLTQTYIGNPWDGVKDATDYVAQRAQFNAQQEARNKATRLHDLEELAGYFRNKVQGNVSVTVH
jgi:hypothetical protein